MSAPSSSSRVVRIGEAVMGLCLAVMATVVFVNVALRYGFGRGIAASEELSRLLFVWMVFIGATLAYPLGQHMAFTGLLRLWRRAAGGRLLAVLTRLIHALVLLGCVLVGWGAWQQVIVGLGSRSVVLGYPIALLPLPALLAACAIGAMASNNLWRGHAIDLGADLECDASDASAGTTR